MVFFVRRSVVALVKESRCVSTPITRGKPCTWSGVGVRVRVGVRVGVGVARLGGVQLHAARRAEQLHLPARAAG